MTDTSGNIDEATKAARAAAEHVEAAATDTTKSFGASAEQIADDLAAGAGAAIGDTSATAGDVSDRAGDKLSDVLETAKNAAADAKAAAAKAAESAAEAAKAAGAKLKGAADDVDFDQIAAQTRTVAGEWTERLKTAYRERPAVVIAAAAGVVVVAASLLRNLGRR